MSKHVLGSQICDYFLGFFGEHAPSLSLSSELVHAQYRIKGVKIVYVARFAADQFGWTLDAIRWLAAPGPRRAAHLTFLGPYDEPDDPVTPESLDRLTARLLDAQLTTHGPGMFKRGRRRTLYLAAESTLLTELADVAEREFVPHITMYSGSNRGWAAELESVLRRTPSMPLRISGVERVVVGAIEDPLSAEQLGLSPALAETSPAVRLEAINELVADLKDAYW